MQTLRVEDTDPRLEFGPDGAWTVQDNYHYSETAFSRFFILFRGTGIKIYGQYGNNGSTLLITADGANWVPIPLNGTSDGTKQIWNITGLQDGDHQVLGLTNTQNGGNSIWIDYVELENAAGTGFDPRDSGANATGIPQEAVVVEDTDSSIQYSPRYQWNTIHDVQYHGPNLTGTNQNGTSLIFTFEGVAVWYYSDVGPPHGSIMASIDGSSPEWASGYTSAPTGLARQLIWSKTGLPPGRHNLTLTHAGQQGQYFTVDFFRVLRNEGSSTSYSTSGTWNGGIASSDATLGANTSQGYLDQSRLGIAIGVPLGVMLLVGLTAFVMIRRHRRRQTSYIQRSSVPPMSQQLPTPGDSSATSVLTASTIPLPLTPSVAPTSQSLATHMEWGSSSLSGVEVPPPYRSPGPTSRY